MPRTTPSTFAVERLRQRLVTQVKDFFTDVEEGEGPTPASDEALFEKDSPIRMVHADVVAMMIGGIRGLLLQMLHPHALQGVLDYSDFRSDAHGRYGGPRGSSLSPHMRIGTRPMQQLTG